MRYLFCLIFLLILLPLPALATAPAPVGTVIGMEGQAWAATDGTRRGLRLQAKVHAGEELLTGDNSKLQILFNDDSILSLGSQSSMVIDRYVYDPDRAVNSGLVQRMQRGTFRTVTGRIAEQNPENFEIQSPLAVIGIRGTDIVGMINPDGTHQEIGTMSGRIQHMSHGQIQQVTPGNSVVATPSAFTYGPMSPGLLAAAMDLGSVGFGDADNGGAAGEDEATEEGSWPGDESDDGAEGDGSDGHGSLLLKELASMGQQAEEISSSQKGIGVQPVPVLHPGGSGLAYDHAIAVADPEGSPWNPHSHYTYGETAFMEWGYWAEEPSSLANRVYDVRGSLISTEEVNRMRDENITATYSGTAEGIYRALGETGYAELATGSFSGVVNFGNSSLSNFRVEFTGVDGSSIELSGGQGELVNGQYQLSIHQFETVRLPHVDVNDGFLKGGIFGPGGAGTGGIWELRSGNSSTDARATGTFEGVRP